MKATWCLHKQAVDKQMVQKLKVLNLQLLNLQLVLVFKVLQRHTFSLEGVWGSFWGGGGVTAGSSLQAAGLDSHMWKTEQF